MELRKSRLVLSGVLAQLVLLMVLHGPAEVDSRPQEGGFELPVELVGFPVIITAVRLSNFVKKLAYSLNPNTYATRTKRQAVIEGSDKEEFIDMEEAEKRLVEKFGEHVCVYKRVCLQYANRANNGERKALDWNDILTQYKTSPDRNKEFHLLSVFLGDIVGSTKFCNQLSKRRPCEDS